MKEIRHTAYIIGIQQYDKDLTSLKTPINDASRLAKLLEHQFGYQVKLLLKS